MSDKLKVKKSILKTMDNLLINSSINNSNLTNQFGGMHSGKYTQSQLETMIRNTTQQFMMLCQQAIYEKQRIQNEINKYSNKANTSKHIVDGASSVLELFEEGTTDGDSDSPSLPSGTPASDGAVSSSTGTSAAAAVALGPLQTVPTVGNVPIIGIIFKENDKDRDFLKMIKQPKYANSLFIFNDNVTQHKTGIYKGSSGNGPMRRYNKYGEYNDRPRSAGIPTGDGGGFTSLTQVVKDKAVAAHIDNAIEDIKSLMSTYTYDNIFYSSGSDGMIGIKEFKVDAPVLQYITHHIQNLSKAPLIVRGNTNANVSKQELPGPS